MTKNETRRMADAAVRRSAMTEKAEQESAAKSSWTDQIEPAANITGQRFEGRMLASIAMSLKRLADQVDGVVARGELSTAIFNGITEGIWRAKSNG